MSVSVSDRAIRAGSNHLLFRAGNERLKKFNEEWFGQAPPRGGWVCECANDTCLQYIEMTTSEYEVLRHDGARFFVAPSEEHVWPDVERVIERRDGYWIVETLGHAQHIARHTSPRQLRDVSALENNRDEHVHETAQDAAAAKVPGAIVRRHAPTSKTATRASVRNAPEAAVRLPRLPARAVSLTPLDDGFEPCEHLFPVGLRVLGCLGTRVVVLS